MTRNDKTHFRPYTDGKTPYHKTNPIQPAIIFPHNNKEQNFWVDSDIKSR